MSAGLVENNSAKPVFNSNSHLACLTVIGSEIYERLVCRLCSYILGQNRVEHFKSHSSSRRAASRLIFSVFGSHRIYHHTSSRMSIAYQEPLCIGYQNLVLNAGKSSHNLRNKRTAILCGKASTLKDICLERKLRCYRVYFYGMNINYIFSVKADRYRRTAFSERICCRACTRYQSLS